MRKIAILGASGHGKVVAEIAELNGFDEIVFFDDAWKVNDRKAVEVEQCGRANFPWKVVGNTESLLSCLRDFEACAVGIGDNGTRWEKLTSLKRAGVRLALLIHPNATVSRYAELGAGVVVMANATINPFVKVGEACIINTGSSIDHDCIVGHAVHVSPGANIGGGVEIDDKTWIGIGACVRPSCKIGSDVIVGAGAAVVKDIPDHQTVVGVPARTQIDSSSET